jgi:Xaa-Pro dipeptidase
MSRPAYHYKRFPDFPETEYEARWERLRARMAAAGLDAVLLTTEANMRYFAGLKTTIFRLKMRPMFAILPADARRAPALVLPEFLEATALATSWIDDIRTASECYGKRADDAVDILIGALKDMGLERAAIGMELGDGHHLAMSQTQLDHLRADLADARWADAAPEIWALRRVKSPLEVEALQTACDISAAGVRAGLDILRPGLTEAQLYARITATYYQEGAEDHLLGIHSTAKGNQVRDALPSDYPFEPGHFMKIDGGAVYKGYCCDFCRLLSVGPTSDQRRRAMEASAAAFYAAAGQARAGARVSELYPAVDALLAQRGYACFWNAIGHGLGLDVWEPPFLLRENHDPLVAGNVLSIEIGVVDAELFDDASFTFEDNIVVTESGYRRLTDQLPIAVLESA